MPILGQKFSNARYTDWGEAKKILFDYISWWKYVEMESGLKKIWVLNHFQTPYCTALLRDNRLLTKKCR